MLLCVDVIVVVGVSVVVLVHRDFDVCVNG